MIPQPPRGRSRRPGQSPLRVPFDFYATPPEATRALLSVEDFDGPIWEPACGQARSAVCCQCWLVRGLTDLIDRGYGTAGIDFLRETAPRAKHIITNPPYGGGLADKFIGKALALTRQTGGKVAMLLDLASLCHPTRHPRFVATPPAALYALDELVCLPNGDPDRARFMARAGRRYYWAVWTPDHAGRPSFWWLATAAFKSAFTAPITLIAVRLQQPAQILHKMQQLSPRSVGSYSRPNC